LIRSSRWCGTLVAASVLAGCATAPSTDAPDSIPGQRHSTEQILRYQPNDFRWRATTTNAEAAMRASELAKLERDLTLPPGPEATAALPAILGRVLMFNTHADAARQPTLSALVGLPEQSTDYQRAVLSAAYRLYAADAAPYLWPLLPKLDSPREYAIAAYALIKADSSSATRERLATELQRKFPTWREEPRLRALGYALGRLQPQAQPPLSDLFASPLRPGYPVVFSVQRAGRPAQGLALVRAADGRFLREADGRLFAIPQLARALSNLPGTITLGNTPQGVFTVRGAGTAENPWIGPTPFLESKLPVEAGIAEFLHEVGDQVIAPGDKTANLQGWDESRYAVLLAPTWRDYEPIKEAWLAGRAGRNEILMHGTVVNPDYYRGDPYYPGTPSAGCLVADETWDRDSGRLVCSNQLRLAQAFARATGSKDAVPQGFLVVVDLPQGVGPVDIEELMPHIIAAESRTDSVRR
jgi:hypothetical protein